MAGTQFENHHFVAKETTFNKWLKSYKLEPLSTEFASVMQLIQYNYNHIYRYIRLDVILEGEFRRQTLHGNRRRINAVLWVHRRGCYGD